MGCSSNLKRSRRIREFLLKRPRRTSGVESRSDQNDSFNGMIFDILPQDHSVIVGAGRTPNNGKNSDVFVRYTKFLHHAYSNVCGVGKKTKFYSRCIFIPGNDYLWGESLLEEFAGMQGASIDIASQDENNIGRLEVVINYEKAGEAG